MIIKDVVIIDGIDKPNKNGRVYSREVCEKIVRDSNKLTITGQIGMPTPVNGTAFVDERNITHTTSNFRIEDDKLKCDIKIIRHKEYFEAMQEIGILHFRTAGISTISRDGVIGNDYMLHSINCVSEPS